MTSIIEELHKLRGKPAGDFYMVVCPFHDDVNPSCGVNVKTGWFNCLGCGKKGDWNTFAEKTGLEKFKYIKPKLEIDLPDLGVKPLSKRGVFKKLGCPEAQPWPRDMDWRGISGKLLSRCAYISLDNYQDSISIIFLASIGESIKGGVKSSYKKTKGSSYYNMKGNWAESYGLLFYNQPNPTKYIILTEGPRDSLRLIQDGLPAMSILGSQQFNKTKANLVLALRKKVFIMPDGDSSGRDMKKLIKSYIPDATYLKLPEGEDPASISTSVLKTIKSKIDSYL